MSGPALRVVDVDCLYKEGDGGQIAIIPPVINVAYRSGGGGGRGRAGCVRDRHHTRGYPRSPCKPLDHQPLCLPLNITTRNSLWWTTVALECRILNNTFSAQRLPYKPSQGRSFSQISAENNIASATRAESLAGIFLDV